MGGPPLGLCSVGGGNTCFTKLKDFSTERMRAGYDLNGWLLFGTAGAGFGRVSAGQNPCTLTVFGGNSCGEEWRAGWVAGVGIEKMFLPHWSAKLEYLHYDFGSDFNYMPAAIGGGNAVHVLECRRHDPARHRYQFDMLGLLRLNFLGSRPDWIAASCPALCRAFTSWLGGDKDVAGRDLGERSDAVLEGLCQAITKRILRRWSVNLSGLDFLHCHFSPSGHSRPFRHGRAARARRR